jgi:hypothetical protein
MAARGKTIMVDYGNISDKRGFADGSAREQQTTIG